MRILPVLLTILFLSERATSLTFVVHLCLVARSHLNFATGLVDALVDRGHTVDLVLGRLNSHVHDNGTSKARYVFSYGLPEKSGWPGSSGHLDNPFANVKMSADVFHFELNRLCEDALSSEVISFLREGDYDAALVSDYDYCGHILMAAAGIRTNIGFTATGIIDNEALLHGLPSPVSAVVDNLSTKLVANGIVEKLQALYSVYTNRKQTYEQVRIQENLALQKLGNMTPLIETIRNVDLVFLNAMEMLEQSRPLSPKFRFVGGVSIAPPKEIDQKMKSILNNASEGVVLFSFGTQVKAQQFPIRYKRIFLETFQKFPNHTFIWKYDRQLGDDALFQKVNNVITVPWIAQRDLLCSSMISAFITHMGMNSFLEAATEGVPVLAIPIFADQHHNANNAVAKRIGVKVNARELSVSSLENALRKVLFDPSYKEKAQEMSRLIRNHPALGKEEFVKWAEFAATHKGIGKLYLASGHDLSVVEYYCIDCVFAVAAVLGVFVLTVGWIWTLFVTQQTKVKVT